MKKGWERMPLDEAVFIQEGPGIRSYEYQKGGFPMINVRCVQNGYIDLSTCNAANVELANGKWKHFQVNEGDILFTISGSIGRTAIVKKTDLPLLMNTSVVRFRSKTGKLRDDFFFYYLQTDAFLDRLHFLSSGTAQKNVGPTHLKTMDVPVPPLAEQQRIVGVLDEAFAGLATAQANAEKNLQNARALFESHLRSVFTHRGKGWVEKPLGELCDFLNGFAFKSGDAVADSGTQLVRMGNLYGSKLDLERNAVFYPDSFAVEYRRFILNEGDIIMSLTGTTGKEDYGFAVRVPECDQALLMNQRIAKFDSIREDKVSRGYLLHYLRSRAFLDILYPTANGTRQANLSTVTMKTLPVPLCAIPEQKQIVAKLDALATETQRLESHYAQKQAALAVLKKSLLHQAFTGNL